MVQFFVFLSILEYLNSRENSFLERVRFSFSPARNIKGCPMVRRGSYFGEASCEIYAPAKSQGLERDQQKWERGFESKTSIFPSSMSC